MGRTAFVALITALTWFTLQFSTVIRIQVMPTMPADQRPPVIVRLDPALCTVTPECAP